MGKWIWILMIVAMVSPIPALLQNSGVQVISHTSAEAVLQNGSYYLQLSGNEDVIHYVCSFGDCGKSSPDRISALNYWASLNSIAYGISIVPIPNSP